MDDAAKHIKELESRVSSLEAHMKNLPKKSDIYDIVREALRETFLTLGKGTKVAIITTATIVGSMVVIGGGLKWLLAIVGFTYVGSSQ